MSGTTSSSFTGCASSVTQAGISIDIYPYRNEGLAVLKRTVQVVDKCCRMADKLLEMNVEQIIRNGETMEAMRILWEMVG